MACTHTKRPLRSLSQTKQFWHAHYRITVASATHCDIDIDDQPLFSRPAATNDFCLKREEILRDRRMNKYRTSFRKSRPTRVNGTDKVKKKLPQHLLEVYTSMMHDLHKRDWKHAIQTLRQSVIEKDADDDGGANHHVVLYTVAIRACCVSGKFPEAVKLYEQMHDKAGIAPDAVTLIAMLKGCAIIRDWQQSQFWYGKIMRDGGLSLASLSRTEQHSIHSLRISSADRYTWQHAWQLFQSLGKDKEDKDMILYNAMLEVLARSQRYEHCEQLFVDISNDDALRRQMDIYTFASMIRACVPHGQIERALNCMTIMQSTAYKLKPNALIITDILRTLKNYRGQDANAFVLAHKLWSQVIDVNQPLITPDAVLFGVMIDLCCRHDEFEYALNLFRDMVSVYHIRPSLIVFNNLLKCAVHAQQSMQYLQGLVRDLQRVYGVSADRVTHSILLNAMIRHTQGQLQTAYAAQEQQQQQHDDAHKHKHEMYVYIAELLTFWQDWMVHYTDEVVYCTLINALFHMNAKYFISTDDGDRRGNNRNHNIIQQQMMALYASGCAEKYLGHWSASTAVHASYVRDANLDANENDFWVLEMHGWPVGVACVAIEYFFECELENMCQSDDECRHVLIAVGKGKHSEDNVMVLQPRTLQYIQQHIGIKNVQYLPENACLFIHRDDMKSYLQSHKLLNFA